MASQKILNEENVDLILGLIKKAMTVGEAIDDTSVKTDGTYSSYKILELLKKYYTNTETDAKIVESLTNYYTKGETLTADEVRDLIDSISIKTYEVVTSLPETDINQDIIYLIEIDSDEHVFSQNLYDGSKWLKLGGQSKPTSTHVGTVDDGEIGCIWLA